MLVLSLIFLAIGWMVQSRLKSKFEKYSQTPISSNLSGEDIAKKMLRDNGIYDVKVICVEGQLTDHYNPADKTVNLSQGVYYGRNAAAAAVSAHECGHAVQHATAYNMLQLRSTLVPVVSFASKWVTWILFGGVLALRYTNSDTLLFLGICLFAATTLFSLVTLPVEFDASNRALAWLETSGVSNTQEHENAKDALWWAAMTYVVAAIASVATLLYYIMIYMGVRRG